MREQRMLISTPCFQKCFILTAILVCCFTSAAGHALMIHPPSRNWMAYLQESFYWAHGLSGGGARANAGDNLSWPDINIDSYCGGGVGDSKWDVLGPVQTIYVKGQTIDVDVLVAVNHLGRFDFRLCSIASRPGDDSRCHVLHRADDKGTFFYLPFVEKWSGGNSGYDPPAYGDGSFSWYRLPSVGVQQGCRRQLTCDQFMGMVVYRTKWRLPEGVTCQHCKLQWRYMTAHSCWPPCPAANADEPTCKNVQVYPECGQPGTTYPEHFFNCADVRVVDGLHARPPGLKDTPVWEPQVTLHSGTFGTPAAYRMSEALPVQNFSRPSGSHSNHPPTTQPPLEEASPLPWGPGASSPVPGPAATPVPLAPTDAASGPSDHPPVTTSPQPPSNVPVVHI